MPSMADMDVVGAACDLAVLVALPFLDCGYTAPPHRVAIMHDVTNISRGLIFYDSCKL